MAWIAEQLLTAIRDSDMRECITEDRLLELTGLTKRQVQESCRLLRASGLLEKTAQGCHTITEAGSVALESGAKFRSGPKGKLNGKRVYKDTIRLRVWRAVRIRRKFTAHEIITLVADETRGDMTGNVQKYLRALVLAGYLIELPKREATARSSYGYKRYWLSDDKDTGLEAPVFSERNSTVYDPNTKETHDISAHKDEEASS